QSLVRHATGKLNSPFYSDSPRQQTQALQIRTITHDNELQRLWHGSHRSYRQVNALCRVQTRNTKDERVESLCGQTVAWHRWVQCFCLDSTESLQALRHVAADCVPSLARPDPDLIDLHYALANLTRRRISAEFTQRRAVQI